jgi:hypothetical protein
VQAFPQDVIYFPLLSQVAPVDVYGLHVDFHLPDNGIFIGDGSFLVIGKIYDVGPGPKNIVSESGSTFGMLLLVLVALSALHKL